VPRDATDDCPLRGVRLDRRGAGGREARSVSEREDIGGGAGPVRPDHVLLACLAVGVLAAYLVVQRGVIDSWDGAAMASVGKNLLQHGSLKECCQAFGAYPKDPGPYSKYGIGYSLALAPLWHFQIASNPDGALWLGLANPLLLAATTVVIARTGMELAWRTTTVALTALAFALLTSAPIYSAQFFSEPGVAFGSSVMMLGFVLAPRRATTSAALIGIGTGIAILFRPDSIVLLGPIVAGMTLFRWRALLATWRSFVLGTAVPIGLAVGWTLFYDNLRYGKPFQFGYSGYYDPNGFSTPLMRGVSVLLWSPGKSFFVYAPILVAAVPGLVLLARRRPPLAVCITAMFFIRVAFYARWWTPEGGNAWGPRFLFPLCAVLALALGEAIDYLPALTRRARQAAIGVLALLAAASVVVQLASLLVSYRAMYAYIFDVRHLPAALQEPTFANRERRSKWTFSDGHVMWNLRHIGSRTVQMPLYWFHGGATRFGIGMLAVAALMCACAVRVAVVSDRRRAATRSSVTLASHTVLP
jgi:hypothetical protein